MTPLTVREACRRGIPLDGSDAKALEHALTITERERDALRAELAAERSELRDLEGQVDRLHAMSTATASRDMLVASLGQEMYNALWGPGLERIGEAVDVALSRAEKAEAEVARLTEELKESREWREGPLPEDDAIDAAFPTRSGSHETYAEAMRLVGARQGKHALVALVNWLLVARDRLTAECAAMREALATCRSWRKGRGNSVVWHCMACDQSDGAHFDDCRIGKAIAPDAGARLAEEVAALREVERCARLLPGKQGTAGWEYPSECDSIEAAITRLDALRGGKP